MNIKKTPNGSTLTITVEGRLDTVTAPDLEKEINASIADVKELILDFAGLDYISSAGLRLLLSAQKKMAAQGSMKVVHVNDVVNEVFNITGFCDILTIE
ncbi:MAG: STAS domain-containing protein [Clostridia bacterium]|jgi:anti-sigma B factor antagonist|nr:STAS domain-containing protein [Clostridia bacterium]